MAEDEPGVPGIGLDDAIEALRADLIAAMQADTVCWRRVPSDYRSSERGWRLGGSDCVYGYLEPLSLG